MNNPVDIEENELVIERDLEENFEKNLEDTKKPGISGFDTLYPSFSNKQNLKSNSNKEEQVADKGQSPQEHSMNLNKCDLNNCQCDLFLPKSSTKNLTIDWENTLIKETCIVSTLQHSGTWRHIEYRKKFLLRSRISHPHSYCPVSLLQNS